MGHDEAEQRELRNFQSPFGRPLWYTILAVFKWGNFKRLTTSLVPWLHVWLKKTSPPLTQSSLCPRCPLHVSVGLFPSRDTLSVGTTILQRFLLSLLHIGSPQHFPSPLALSPPRFTATMGLCLSQGKEISKSYPSVFLEPETPEECLRSR